jgi:hypothetical protein
VEPADPDTLVRRKAGTYRTADDRFEVQEADAGWFLVDTAEVNDFGQPLMQGPFATLAAVREALPGARKTKTLPGRATGAARARTSKAKASSRSKAAASAPPPSWIDELPGGEGRDVRRLIGALEREGLTEAEAESLVRRDRDGLLPAVASRLIEQRLDALVDEQPADERKRARDLVRRATEILTAQGAAPREPLPRWTLVEIGPEGEPENRRIVI